MKTKHRAPVALFLSILLVGALTIPIAVGSADVSAPILDGGWTRAFEAEYTEKLPFRDVALAVVASIRYGLFREGRRGVLVGDAGWLFTTEEYRGATVEQADAETVETAYRELLSRGIPVVVVLVPAKARIYAEYAPSPLPPAADRRYAAFAAELRARGVPVTDLVDAFLGAKVNGELFHRTDTHWTALGTKVAAEVVARVVDSHFPDLALPSASFAEESIESTQFEGDLVSFLGLGALSSRLGPPPEEVTAEATLQANTDSVGLFGAVSIPIALVGTSYSADPRWGFEAALKRALGADVLSVAEEAGGPFDPMRRYLEGETIADVPPELVIWEIPERYVSN